MAKRKYKSRKKKSFYKKRKTSSLSLYRPSIFPDVMKVQMKYATNIVLTNVSGFGHHVFALNDIFDPDVTSAGHQPLGHDQWANFYQNYEVKSSKMIVRCLPPDVNPVRYGSYPSITTTVTASTNNLAEQPYAKIKIMNDTTIAKNSYVSNYMTVAKLEGRNTSSLNYQADFGGSPAARRFWIVAIASLTGTSISDIVLDIRIVYYVRMFRRITLTQS